MRFPMLLRKNLCIGVLHRAFARMPRPMLAAFDFDHTIANDNTDIVARKLLPDDKLPASVRDLYRSMGWIPYMSKIFELLHEYSIDSKQVEQAIVNIQAVPGIERLLRELHANGFEIIIISDSNTIFIDQWLKSKKLEHVIERVFTNPARLDENGMMCLDMYHVQDSCKLSTVNLCKGQILEDYIKKRAVDGTCFERVVYVGDGRNDLCPILRLSELDFAFPRKEYVLIKLLNSNEKSDIPPIRAKVIPWSDGTEILRTLQEALNLSKKCI